MSMAGNAKSGRNMSSRMSATWRVKVWPRRPRAAAAVAFVFSAVAACLPVPRSEAAAFPGEDGRIAFQSNRSGSWEIYTMRSDGSDVTRLTRNDVYDGQPAISSDGRRIVFVRDFSSGSSENPARRYGDIWIMRSDGSDQRRITDRQGRTPAWSPDGRRWTFSSLSGNGCAFGRSYESIFVFNEGADVGRKLTATCDPAFNPSFSADGSEILIEGTSYKATPFGEEALLWVDPNRSRPDGAPGTVGTLVPTEQFRGYSLSSDGKEWVYGMRKRGGLLIPFRDNSSLYVTSAGGRCGQCGVRWGIAGRSYDRLTFGADDVRPSFAPEGDRIAFERNLDRDTEIFVSRNDPRQRQVTQLTMTGKNMAPDWGPRSP
jgi:Tol biopolymer transport system component